MARIHDRLNHDVNAISAAIANDDLAGVRRIMELACEDITGCVGDAKTREPASAVAEQAAADAAKESEPKPIEDMTKKELLAYADEHGMNVDASLKVADIREQILAATNGG